MTFAKDAINYPLFKKEEKEPLVLEWHRASHHYFHSLRWKILSIAMISAIGFFLYLVFTLTVTIKNSSQLNEVSNHAMPVMYDLQNAMFELRLSQNALQDVVITADIDLIDEAKIHADRFRSFLKPLNKMDDIKSTELLSEFNKYFEYSLKLAEEISDYMYADIEKFENQGGISANLYKNLLGKLQKYNTENVEYFNNELTAATERSKNLFLIGLFGGITMIIIVFSIALLTIKSIGNRIDHLLGSLKKLAIDSSDMSARIDVQGTDEMAELAHWFNTFVIRLNFLTKKSNESIRQMAFSDVLTDLPNRREFLRCLENELAFMQSRPSKKLAVFFMDLDNFKTVNDQKGHDAGDELIRNVAKSLQSVIRDYDVLGFVENTTSTLTTTDAENVRSVVARMGGDEFMLLLSNLDDIDAARSVAERILKTIARVHVIQGTEFLIGVSIGVSLCPDDGTDVEDLINNADEAMYQAKNNGKNNFVFYNHVTETKPSDFEG